jgi:hypothetical protein
MSTIRRRRIHPPSDCIAGMRVPIALFEILNNADVGINLSLYYKTARGELDELSTNGIALVPTDRHCVVTLVIDSNLYDDSGM